MTDDETNGNQGGGSPTIIAERYEVGELVGRSAMAETHRAHDRVLGTTVAVKFLSPQLAEDRVFAERFVSEALDAAKIKNPNILEILDAGTAGDLRYVVQEFAEGETLDKKLKRKGKLDDAAASEIAEKLLSALSVAHAAGIVHKDINPANIIFTESGDVKLADLGIARVESPQTVAQTRAIMGTAAYLSPEQAQGEAVDGRADIYSMSIVLYEMLAGQPPFQADSPVAVAYMHVRDVPKPVGEVNPDVPAPLAEAVMKALAKKPDDRFQTADDFRQSLETARVGKADQPSDSAAAAGPESGEAAAATEPIKPFSGTETMAFSSPTASRGERGPSRRTWIIIGAVVLIALLGAGYYFFLTPRDKVVPDLRGLSVIQAGQALDRLDLDSKILLQESNEVAAGTVMGQAPLPGIVVGKGTTVILTVAKAATNVTVPNVVGLSETQAKSQLDTEGLQLGEITSEDSDTEAPGTVLSQDPVAGTLVPGGVSVSLTVAISGGPSIVPNVACYSADRAATVLAEADLQMTVAGVEANDLCPATGIRVARQDPPAGGELGSGAVVTVWTTQPLPSTGISPSPGASTSPAPFSPMPSPSPLLP